MNKTIIGIDASNIISGGGKTHLVELINASSIKEKGIEKVIVWANKDIANCFSKKNWLEICEIDHLKNKTIFSIYTHY